MSTHSFRNLGWHRFEFCSPSCARPQDRLDLRRLCVSFGALVDLSTESTLRRRGRAVSRAALALGGLIALALVVAIAGWDHRPGVVPWLQLAARAVLWIYALGQVGQLVAASDRHTWVRRRWPLLLLGLGAAVMAVEFGVTLDWLHAVFPNIAVAELTLLLIAGTQIPVLADFGLRLIRFQNWFADRRVSPGVVMMITFGGLIVAGTLLLQMPRATIDGISWLDALFTSTSAVCVTGLVVVDTETAFTPTGRVILLLLIQIGGLGVMTLTTFLASMFGGFSLRGRVLLQDLVSEENIGRIGRTLPMILGMTLAFEAAGAVALHAAMADAGDPRGTGWFPAVFHSVSAFCNAGFSTWSGGLYDPVVRDNVAVQGIVMVLVVAGGMGFPVMYATVGWLAGRANRIRHRHQRRVVLSLHARLAWTTTVALIVIGAGALWVAESRSGAGAQGGASIMTALFNSITARTAGFNINPIEGFSPAAVMLMIFLMFIGGCPGSTAGGVKTTAFAVALLNARRIVMGHDDVTLFGRRLSEETVARALAVVLLAMTWVAVMSVALAVLEPGFPLADLVFEVVSAVSTVGLTRGVTPELGEAGKALIILTMFAGRVGLLYFVFAFVRRRDGGAAYRLPQEQVIVA